MQELAIPLLVHGETHGFVLDREREFLAVYDWLATRFPRLTIIMEHITTREAVALLDRYPNVYATVTLHHLLYTLDDIAGGLLQPHLFCKPLAKRPEDRDASLAAALSAHPKLMFGSDSAPHPQSAKECSGCAAGVFAAPVALPRLVELFEQHHALDRLQAFVSDNAQRIYDIQPPHASSSLKKRPGWYQSATVPSFPCTLGRRWPGRWSQLDVEPGKPSNVWQNTPASITLKWMTSWSTMAMSWRLKASVSPCDGVNT